MIPVEKIAGGTLNNVVLYVGIVGLLLVAAALIRLKVPFLRKAFIPASLLAGLIGMILGPYFLKVIPADMMSSIGALPTPMITIVFACMLLGIKKEEADKGMVRDAAAGLAWLQQLYAGRRSLSAVRSGTHPRFQGQSSVRFSV